MGRGGKNKETVFLKGCAGKVQHKTQLSAEFYLHNINSEKHAEIYNCTQCGFFHIGTIDKNKTKKPIRNNILNWENEYKIRVRKMRY